MLTYLQSGKVYKISELVTKLENETGDRINPRNIIEYRKELELAGYRINVFSGKYGGYQLDKSSLFPTIQFSSDEKQVLIDAYEYLSSKICFLKKDVLDKAFGKIYSSFNNEIKHKQYISIDKDSLVMDENELKIRFDAISKCVTKKRKVRISYESSQTGIQSHIVHPYKLFLNNDEWYFFAWNPEIGNVWYYKLTRIIDYEILDETFTIWKYFDPKNYINEYGLKKDGEWYEIEFIVSGPYATRFKEKRHGKNQKIEPLEDGRFRVNFSMQNKQDILSLMLAGGDYVEKISPRGLIKHILKKEKILFLNL